MIHGIMKKGFAVVSVFVPLPIVLFFARMHASAEEKTALTAM